MTREEAERRAAELNAEHPERHRYRWLARGDGDAWEVARVEVPGGVRLDPLKQAVESRPRPEAPDPRTPFDPNVVGPW